MVIRRESLANAAALLMAIHHECTPIADNYLRYSSADVICNFSVCCYELKVVQSHLEFATIIAAMSNKNNLHHAAYSANMQTNQNKKRNKHFGGSIRYIQCGTQTYMLKTLSQCKCSTLQFSKNGWIMRWTFFRMGFRRA